MFIGVPVTIPVAVEGDSRCGGAHFCISVVSSL